MKENKIINFFSSTLLWKNILGILLILFINFIYYFLKIYKPNYLIYITEVGTIISFVIGIVGGIINRKWFEKKLNLIDNKIDKNFHESKEQADKNTNIVVDTVTDATDIVIRKLDEKLDEKYKAIANDLKFYFLREIMFQNFNDEINNSKKESVSIPESVKSLKKDNTLSQNYNSNKDKSLENNTIIEEKDDFI